MAERAGVLRIGDRVVFAGAERSVVALSGSLVRLMADSGETTVVAMAYLAGAPDFAVVGAGPSAPVAVRGEPLHVRPAHSHRTCRDLLDRRLARAGPGRGPDG